MEEKREKMKMKRYMLLLLVCIVFVVVTICQMGKDKECMPEELTMFNVSVSTKYDSSQNLRMEVGQIHIMDDGYQKLKTVLEAYNKEMIKKSKDFMADYSNTKTQSCGYYIEIAPWRTDSKILSFSEKERKIIDGESAEEHLICRNYAPASGKMLDLKDVITDMNQLFDKITQELQMHASAYSLYPDYEKTLYRLIYEQSKKDDSLQWFVDFDGVTLSFAPYSLSTKRVEIPLLFTQYSDLIMEQYVYTADERVYQMEIGVPLSVDLYNDGIMDVIEVKAQEKDVYMETDFSITCNEHALRQTFYGYVRSCYLMAAGKGQYYLYTEILWDDDIHVMEIFHIQRDGVKYVGHFDDGGFCYQPVFYPEHMNIYTRIDALGTYPVYRAYSIGSDGMPVPLDETYILDSYSLQEERVLLSTRELKVVMEQKGGEVQKTLPPGTEFRFRKTDGASYVEMELKNGASCVIPLERREGEYGFEINGVNEYDCFEMLPYAG